MTPSAGAVLVEHINAARERRPVDPAYQSLQVFNCCDQCPEHGRKRGEQVRVLIDAGNGRRKRAADGQGLGQVGTHDSPSVGGSDASTVGAPGGAPTVAPPGTWLISPNPSAYVAHVVRPDGRGRSMCGLVTPRGGWTSAETPLHCASCERALAAS